LANIAWCEPCAPLKSPMLSDNISIAQYYAHVPSSPYQDRSVELSMTMNAGYEEEEEEEEEGKRSNSGDNNWEMKWLFESSSPRPGGLASLESYFGSMQRVEPHSLNSSGGSGGSGPFEVQNIVVMLMICAMFGCICKVLFGGDKDTTTTNTQQQKRRRFEFEDQFENDQQTMALLAR
jgi:hypothetical protein